MEHYRTSSKRFFTLPNEVFLLKLPSTAFVVYAYLLLIEDRRTRTCHPSYNTIAAATGVAKNTELVDIYADEGISGLESRNRDEFNRMIADCRAGRIDLILVKSISHIQYVRELLRLGVSIRFEKENIDTGKMSSEQIAQIYGAFAQMESTNHSSKRMISIVYRSLWFCVGSNSREMLITTEPISSAISTGKSQIYLSVISYLFG